MTLSMTGYASRRGQWGAWGWTWDLRSVNGKGLDVRLRLPEWIEGLEPLVRADLGRVASRGNIALTLKVAREGADEGAAAVNLPVLRGVLAALAVVEAEAMARGITLRQAGQAEVLAMRGVLETAALETDTGPLRDALMADLGPLLADFAASRAAEGAALAGVLAAQLDRIAALAAEARVEAEARRDVAAATLRENLARVLANADGADEGRVAQELAMLAVKADVTEELDRLDTHIGAARVLLADAAPVGRKFDFLMQEFMREANTLCSKSQARALTRVGLDLKTVIDQMREQVQNVE
ncbi:MAG TPA: YicC/YloC family endoribonuclease [Paracoccaceae bacterium]|nr:YicC/YloC family endoribonuclease [Paracoccaceae bacterium]